MPAKRKPSKSAASPACENEPSSYVNLCLERLREEGGRISSARLSVIRVLAKAEKPLVPKEIVQRARRASGSGSLDLVSVYRNIEALVEKGLVHQIGNSGGYFPCLHSSCGMKVHLLTHCESCEQTQEIHIPEAVTKLLKELIAPSGKAMSQISTFQIDGICRRCVKRA
jgi:Fe2+ or Zn2+ uptake regulation protein